MRGRVATEGDPTQPRVVFAIQRLPDTELRREPQCRADR